MYEGMSVVWPARSFTIQSDGGNVSCTRNSLTEQVWSPTRHLLLLLRYHHH